MLVVGLLLVVVSAAGAALVIAYNNSGGPEQTVVLFGQDWVRVTPLQAFIAGLVAAMVFAIGVWMIAATERRRRVVRSEYRDARREARVATRERDRLARELAERDEAPAQRWSEPVTEPTPTPPLQHGETTQTQGPVAPKRRFGRHFRRSEARSEAEETASSTPPQ